MLITYFWLAVFAFFIIRAVIKMFAESRITDDDDGRPKIGGCVPEGTSDRVLYECYVMASRRGELGVDGYKLLAVVTSKYSQFEAASWLEIAAEKGDAEAQTLLGTRYAEGVGVNKDYNQAIGWWNKAAGQGYAAAQYNLACTYLKGQYVEKDIEKFLSYGGF